MIEISNLQKSFGRQVVLRNIDLSVPKGRTLAILGRSGSGKSVLLKCIVGLIHPDAGSIEIDGVEVVGLASKQLNALRRRIGYVFQNAALYDSMTVEENLAFHLTRHNRMPADACRQIIREKLRFVGMEEAMHKHPAELSGGMQKRVGLARALVLSPEIMLYDEPTTGLDPITAAEIDALIIRLKREQGVTAISITHNPESAYRTADHIAVLHAGSLVAQGTLDDLRQSDHPFVRLYLSQLKLSTIG
jgi:phospholipid/cholesterol/gamma-HCH transport system ATP-binding protein